MKTAIAAGLIATLIVAGCGTRLNPMNWFGGSEETIAAAPAAFTEDARPLVAEVSSLQIERMPGGAIIRATGLPPTQGFWDAELVPMNDEKPDGGALSYQFRLAPPLSNRPASTQRSREVVVAHHVSDVVLQGVRSITVVGAENSRSARR